MANAKRCNRCERFFDPFEIGDRMMCKFQNPIFQNERDIREGMVGKLMLNSSPDSYVDLCPDCAEMFEAFMSGCDLPADSERYYKTKKSYEEEKHDEEDWSSAAGILINGFIDALGMGRRRGTSSGKDVGDGEPSERESESE